jgi:SNF2 family DNA or RNA helicase
VSSLQLFLSGTPVQNKISEFYTLLNLIDEDAFPSRDEFESQYGSMSNSADIQALHKALSPYMFRRMKAEVEKELPPREETLISVEMTSEQKQSVPLHRSERERVRHRGFLGSLRFLLCELLGTTALCTSATSNSCKATANARISPV